MITQYRPSYYQAPRAPSFAGRSVDGKPLDVENGSTFKEIDTGRVFRYDKENNVWIEQKGATPVQPVKPEQAKTVDLDMATGNQTVLPDEGMTLSSATIIKPDTMIPENIKIGVNIGGVVGTAPTPKVEQTKTVDLDMATGNQTINPDEGKVLSSVVVTKPTTLVAENIKKDVNIGGVVGTLEEVPTGQYITETYDPNTGEVASATLHGYTTVPPRQFFEQRNLVSVVLPNEINNIGSSAFYNCANLTLASLPSGITRIVNGVFNGCTNLALTSLPSGVKSIGSYAFNNCTNLALISLPSGITDILEHAFAGCTNLALTSLPSGITHIYTQTFFGCGKLALTSLPIGVTIIDSNAFYNCVNLTLTSLPSELISIGSYAFDGCTNLAFTFLPNGLTNISNGAFNACTNLSLTSLPNGLTSIGDYVFNGCRKLALTSLPGGITDIGNNAFRLCSGLTSITFEGTPTTIASTAFSSCINLIDIKVPWAEGAVANAPWGATNATITYNYTA